MESITLYIALEQSTLVSCRSISIGDIATLYCREPANSYQAKKIKITTMPAGEQSQLVISAIKLIELISNQLPGIHIENIGSPEIIVYYKSPNVLKKYSLKIKAVFLLMIAFFGTAYSIMAYNWDTNTPELLDKLYTLFTGNSSNTNPEGYNFGIISYSLGLAIGMIAFFNHGFNKNSVDDPTPLQVQMRLYEQEINQCIIVDSQRENKTIDVD